MGREGERGTSRREPSKELDKLAHAEALAPVHSAKVLSYLKATGHQLGLLINFKVAKLREGIRRVVLSWQILGALHPPQ